MPAQHNDDVYRSIPAKWSSALPLILALTAAEEDDHHKEVDEGVEDIEEGGGDLKVGGENGLEKLC